MAGKKVEPFFSTHELVARTHRGGRGGVCGGGVGVVGDNSAKFSRQASQNLGKYTLNIQIEQSQC